MMRLTRIRQIGPAPVIIRNQGAKNGLLPHLYAASLFDGTTTLRNAPSTLKDSQGTFSLLRSLGISVCDYENHIELTGAKLDFQGIDAKAAGATRYSALLLGAALAQQSAAWIPTPGGCQLHRGLDIHVEGLRALGAEVEERGGGLSIRPACNRNQGYFRLRSPSVGATLNLCLAAITCEREVLLENVSCEPEVIDFTKFLCAGGARIRWVGAREVVITPTSALRSTDWEIIPDRIAAITVIVAAALFERGVLLKNVRISDMERPLEILQEIGLQFEVDAAEQAIRVLPVSLAKLRPFTIVAEPYPGFPTDLQPILAALASRIEGTSYIHENVFDARFQYTSVLQALGSKIEIDKTIAVVNGEPGRRLTKAEFDCTDIRGGMSCALYAMSHQADIGIGKFSEIERGYVKPAHIFESFGYALIPRND